MDVFVWICTHPGDKDGCGVLFPLFWRYLVWRTVVGILFCRGFFNKLAVDEDCEGTVQQIHVSRNFNRNPAHLQSVFYYLFPRWKSVCS